MSAPCQGRIMLRLMIAPVVKRDITADGLATVTPSTLSRQRDRRRQRLQMLPVSLRRSPLAITVIARYHGDHIFEHSTHFPRPWYLLLRVDQIYQVSHVA